MSTLKIVKKDKVVDFEWTTNRLARAKRFGIFANDPGNIDTDSNLWAIGYLYRRLSHHFSGNKGTFTVSSGDLSSFVRGRTYYAVLVDDRDASASVESFTFPIGGIATPPELKVTGPQVATEGQDVEFVILPSKESTSDLTVNFTITATGSYGVTTGKGTVTLKSNAARVEHIVSTTADSTDEADGSVTLTINAGTGYTVSSTAASVTVTIRDDDETVVVTPVVTITGPGTIVEGANITYALRAAPAPESAITVNLSISTTGEFGAREGTRTVSVGTNGRGSLTVATTNDEQDETDGSVTCTLQRGTGYTVGTPNVVTTSVADNDDPVTPRPDPPVPPVTPPVVDPGPVVDDGSGWKVLTYMKDAEVDLTNSAMDIQVTFGGHRPNTAGALLAPAVGSVTLNNAYREFDTLGPRSDIDVEPGPTVQITFNGEAVFTGWSDGITTVDQGDNHIAVMTLVGPLGRIAGYHRKLFLDLSGEHSVGEVVDGALENVGFPKSSTWPDVGTRKVDDSLVRVHAHGLEQSGITFNSREQVEILQSLQSLLRLEFGRGYDNEDGAIVFESKERTWIKSIDRSTVRDITEDYVHRKVEPAARGVVNIIETKQSAFSEGGGGNIPTVPTLPVSISVPAGQTADLQLHIDTDEWDYVTWDIPVAGTNYTCPIQPGFEYTERRITFNVVNTTSSAVTLRVTRLTGSRFRASGQRVLAVRDDESIARYGLKEILVNTLPYVDTRQQLDFAKYMIGILAGGGNFASLIFKSNSVLARMGDSVKVNVGNGARVWVIDGIVYENEKKKDLLKTTYRLSRPEDPPPLELDESIWGDFRLTYA